MSEHRAEAMRRVRKAHGETFPQSTLQFHPRVPNELEAVICRGCGTPIRGMVDDDRFDEVKVITGRTFLLRRMIFMTLPTYAEAEMTFDDGSKHVTIGCRDCLTKLEPKDLERQYTADLLDWSRQAEATGDPVDWLPVAYRIPVSIRVLKP